MRLMHPISLGVFVFWSCIVLIAVSCGELAARAGRLPDRWVGIGMLCGMVNAGLVVLGICMLSEKVPRIVARVVQIGGMAAAFWSAGTITRALYAFMA